MCDSLKDKFHCTQFVGKVRLSRFNIIQSTFQHSLMLGQSSAECILNRFLHLILMIGLQESCQIFLNWKLEDKNRIYIWELNGPVQSCVTKPVDTWAKRQLRAEWPFLILAQCTRLSMHRHRRQWKTVA